MNGLTATGITVGLCAGIWQLISSQVGLDPSWGLLGTIGFVAFCSFYAAGGGKEGFVKSLFVNYTGVVWHFWRQWLRVDLLRPPECHPSGPALSPRCRSPR